MFFFVSRMCPVAGVPLSGARVTDGALNWESFGGGGPEFLGSGFNIGLQAAVSQRPAWAPQFCTGSACCSLGLCIHSDSVFLEDLHVGSRATVLDLGVRVAVARDSQDSHP